MAIRMYMYIHVRMYAYMFCTYLVCIYLFVLLVFGYISLYMYTYTYVGIDVRTLSCVHSIVCTYMGVCEHVLIIWSRTGYSRGSPTEHKLLQKE